MGDDDSNNNGDNNDEDDSSNDDMEHASYDIQIENAYYEAKQLRDDMNRQEALDGFEHVITMQREHGDELKSSSRKWTFKALKQLVKMHLGNSSTVSATCTSTADDNHQEQLQESQLLQSYNRLLDYIMSSSGDNIVTPNEIEKGINSILERVSSLAIASNYNSAAHSSAASADATEKNRQQLLAMYEATLKVFRPKGDDSDAVRAVCVNDRLWFKTNLKLGQLLYEMNETYKLQNVIKDLLRNYGLESGGGSSSSTHLLEIYALQIQLYSRQKDTKKLRELFRRAMRVEGGIPHPRTLALIQELGGKMHMESREFEMATKTFFQAFKSYDEAGDPSRLRCLKYLVMAGMLDRSAINPFDSQEARPYKDNPEITAMTNLVAAFHNNEIEQFESILRRNEGNIMNDEFVKSHIADLLRTIRTQVLQSVIAPYTRMTLKFLAESLNNISVADVESILVTLILDGKLDGRIDQVRGILIQNCGAQASGADASKTDLGWGNSSVEAQNCAAVDKLTAALDQLTRNVTSVGGRGSGKQDILLA
uniref:PCI domain-containing protein n=1 Tax=Leptocylindrus danicus TaxID=163516 RepID=A0A7S2PLH7_9STRA